MFSGSGQVAALEQEFNKTFGPFQNVIIKRAAQCLITNKTHFSEKHSFIPLLPLPAELKPPTITSKVH